MIDSSALDEYAERYYLSPDASEDMFIEEILQEDVISIVGESLPRGARILEMGYGTGVVAPALQNLGFQVDVVEGSPALCAVARPVMRGKVFEALFEDFETSDPYDAVLCLFTLEHVDDPAAVVRRAITWLMPGGTFVAAVPNRESIHRRVAVDLGIQSELDSLSPRDVLVGHQRVFSSVGLRECLESSGLVDLVTIGSFVKCLPNSMMTEWDPSLVRSLCRVAREIPAELCANLVVCGRRVS